MLNMKVKSISIKGLTKDLLNGYKIINGTKFLALLELGCGNLMECQEKNIENITKWGSNFAPTFVDHHVLSDIKFNGHCL